MRLIYGLFILALVVTGCKKEVNVESLDFGMETLQTTISAGDTAHFRLSGNPDVISFYSGELGNDYDSINGRIMPSQLYLSFQTQVLDGAQADQFSVHASNDFNGDYTATGIRAATWTDISGRFRIATPADNRAVVPSGRVDISDLLAPDRPVYIMYHYINRPNAVYGRYNLWRFQGFLLDAVTPVNAITLANQSTAAWRIVLDGPWETGRVTSTSTSFTFRGNITNTEVYQEAWGVSRGVAASSAVDMGPDHAVAIKAIADLPKTGHTHIYNTPGTYKATFVAANQNVYERKEVVKRVEITVLP